MHIGTHISAGAQNYYGAAGIHARYLTPALFVIRLASCSVSIPPVVSQPPTDAGRRQHCDGDYQ